MLSLYIGYVTGVTDNYHAERIKAVIPPDKGTSIDDIPYAFPLLPKMLHVKPKVGEAVVVIVSNDKNPNAQRYYLGPIISQPEKMNNDNYMALTPTRFITGGRIPADMSIDNKRNTDGAMPKDSEIAILGRKDTDIILTQDDIRIRAGVRHTDAFGTSVEFNKNSPAFIKLKYHEMPLQVATYPGEIMPHRSAKSTATIVADKINLITHNGDEHFNLSDTDEGISDDELENIMAKAHKLPYGEELCDFFAAFLRLYLSHSHASSGAPPISTDPTSIEFFEKYGSGESSEKLKDELLCKDIRIN